MNKSRTDHFPALAACGNELIRNITLNCSSWCCPEFTCERGFGQRNRERSALHSSICHIHLLCILPFPTERFPYLCGRNNNSLTRLITIMAPAITTAQVSNNGVGLGGMGRYRYRRATKDCIIYSLCFLSVHPRSFFAWHPFHFYPRPPTLCFLCLSRRPPHPTAPPPPSPPTPQSLFLANLKFVRRLRLLDGWPLIFCELHLAQTSLRPWCILLTAALVAGPRHLS